MPFNISTFRENFNQIYALAEKNIKLELRFKFRFIMSFINPIIGIIMPLIVMNSFVSYNVSFGPWNSNNFAVYQLLAYDIGIVSGIRNKYASDLNREKIWLTLHALIIAPFNRMNLLLGIFLSHLMLTALPFSLFLILCYIYYPISSFTLLAMLFLFFLLALFFSGIGLIIGTYAISNESIMNSINFIMGLFFYFSCILYPFQLFPESFQAIINLNPLYYIFDVIRLTWIEDNFLFSIFSHATDFLILIIGATAFPFLGVFIFDRVYKKRGIVGY
ncbi:MAG: ABC transporter permease [Candidatus Helarchaeota archaeon]